MLGLEKEVNLAGQVDLSVWGVRLSRATPAEMSVETCAFLCTRSLIICAKESKKIAIDSGLQLCDVLTFLSARLSQSHIWPTCEQDVDNMHIIPTQVAGELQNADARPLWKSTIHGGRSIAPVTKAFYAVVSRRSGLNEKTPKRMTKVIANDRQGFLTDRLLQSDVSLARMVENRMIDVDVDVLGRLIIALLTLSASCLFSFA